MKKNQYRTNKQRSAWNAKVLSNRRYKQGNWDRHIEVLINFIRKVKPYDKNKKV